MASFYGGKKGQDFKITDIVSNLNTLLNNFLNYENESYIVVSYGLNNTNEFANNQQIDNNKFKQNYNATLWRKIVFTTNTEKYTGILLSVQGEVKEYTNQVTAGSYFELITSFVADVTNHLIIKDNLYLVTADAAPQGYENSFADKEIYIEDYLEDVADLLEIYYQDNPVGLNELIGITHYLDIDGNYNTYWYFKSYSNGEYLWNRLQLNSGAENRYTISYLCTLKPDNNWKSAVGGVYIQDIKTDDNNKNIPLPKNEDCIPYVTYASGDQKVYNQLVSVRLYKDTANDSMKLRFYALGRLAKEVTIRVSF